MRVQTDVVSSAPQPFDAEAQAYDARFTHSEAGRLQRKAVWDYLDRQPFSRSPARVLEINCGTGADAVEWARRGHDVTATDSSEAMLAEAAKKNVDASGGTLRFQRLDLLSTQWNLPDPEFDIVFSNFSGLNCFAPDPLEQVLHRIDNVLCPGGRLVLVLFGRHCLAETAYFLLKGRWKSAFRRLSKGPVSAALSEGSLPVWYHRAKTIGSLLPHYSPKGRRAVGLFVPPSYLDDGLRRHPRLTAWAGKLDGIFGGWTALSAYGDHLLLDYQKA